MDNRFVLVGGYPQLTFESDKPTVAVVKVVLPDETTTEPEIGIGETDFAAVEEALSKAVSSVINPARLAVHLLHLRPIPRSGKSIFERDFELKMIASVDGKAGDPLRALQVTKCTSVGFAHGLLDLYTQVYKLDLDEAEKQAAVAEVEQLVSPLG